MTIKSYKFKRLVKSLNSYMLTIPKKWLNELGWTKETDLVLEYHPYKKEIIILEDYRKISDYKPKPKPKPIKKVEI